MTSKTYVAQIIPRAECFFKYIRQDWFGEPWSCSSDSSLAHYAKIYYCLRDQLWSSLSLIRHFHIERHKLIPDPKDSCMKWTMSLFLIMVMLLGLYFLFNSKEGRLWVNWGHETLIVVRVYCFSFYHYTFVLLFYLADGICVSWVSVKFNVL